jgi:predicted MFS family arabinose efflux permease
MSIRLASNRWPPAAPLVIVGGVGHLLRTPGIRGVMLSSLVARLPIGAFGLLLLLRAGELGHSYAVGGLAAGAFSLGLAASPPVLGRIADRRGQRAVLFPSAVAEAAVLGVLASPVATTPAALVALGLLAGAVHPPVGACARVVWARLLDDADRRHAALSLEASLVELSYLLGPLVLVGLFASWSVSAGLAASAVALLAGTVAFAAQPAVGRVGGPGGRRSARALGSPLVRTLATALAALGASFGALEVGITAFAAAHGAPAAVGPLLAVWGAGSLLGGVVTAHRPAPRDPARRLVALLAAMAALDLLLLAAPSILVLGAALVLAGAAIAPAFALIFGLAATDDARGAAGAATIGGEAPAGAATIGGEAPAGAATIGGDAPAGAATEVQAWLSTAIAIGIASGSALGGVVADAVGERGALLLGALAVAVAAVVIAATRCEPRAAAGSSSAA